MGFERRWMSLKLAGYVRTIIVLYKFYNFSCRWHSLMNRPCYNNLVQIIWHEKFWSWNRVIFTQAKYLLSRVKVFWYCFVSLIDEVGSHSRKCELFWNIAVIRYMVLSRFCAIIVQFCFEFNLKWIRWCLCCIVA